MLFLNYTWIKFFKKIRILKWGDYSGLSEWSQCTHKGSYKRQKQVGESDEMWQWKKKLELSDVRKIWLAIASLEGRGRATGQEHGGF